MGKVVFSVCVKGAMWSQQDGSAGRALAHKYDRQPELHPEDPSPEQKDGTDSFKLFSDVYMRVVASVPKFTLPHTQ